MADIALATDPALVDWIARENSVAHRILAEFEPITKKWFYSKVAGSSRRNSNRTSRARIIGECERGDELTLVREPHNKFDPNAIAITSWYAGQLGYIDARTAHEITHSDKGLDLPLWRCFLVHHNLHPETFKVVGANILLIRICPELALTYEAKIAEDKRLQEAQREENLRQAAAAQQAEGERVAAAEQAEIERKSARREALRHASLWVRLKHFFSCADD